MFTLFIIQIILSIALVAVIVLQKSGADGLSGLSSNSSGLVSGRTKANFISKLTSVIALFFMLNSLLLGSLVVKENNRKIVTQESSEGSLPSKQDANTVPLAE